MPVKYRGHRKLQLRHLPSAKLPTEKGTKTSSKYIEVYRIDHSSSKHEGIFRSKISNQEHLGAGRGGMYVGMSLWKELHPSIPTCAKPGSPQPDCYQNLTISLRTTKAPFAKLPCLTRGSSLLSTWIHFMLLACILPSLH